MIPLYSEIEFNKAKSRDLLSLKCLNCECSFQKKKKDIKDFINPKRRDSGDFCSRKCKAQSEKTSIKFSCLNCLKSFYKKPSQIIKTNRHFCSSSCSGTYNNLHKTHGTRRSKLEVWLETKLTELRPNLEIHFNRKDTINSELDIYIPSLKLAFELNGIFHYEPIYGVDKLSQVQSNDNRKFQACLERGIELCIIDISNQTYFKESTSQKFLSIITNIINWRLLIDSNDQPLRVGDSFQDCLGIRSR